MAKSSDSKLKLLYLMKIFLEDTDDAHPLTMPQILDKLLFYGIKAERKSIYSDIELLRQFGIDIIGEKKESFCYYVASREFETAELKLLSDCVSSSKFITQKKSNELIKKLESLTSKNQAKNLRRQVYIMGRVKAMNENIYYNADILSRAITQNKKVSFKYFEYTADKNKKYKNDSEPYIASPYFLTVSEENYYLVSKSPRHEHLTHFRVDKMTNIDILDEKCEEISDTEGENFSISQYSKKLFGMYGGETETVKLECENSIINPVIDKFGEEVFLSRVDKDHFEITVNVNISPVFFSWIFTFEGKMKIVHPKSVIKKFNKTLKKFK